MGKKPAQKAPEPEVSSDEEVQVEEPKKADKKRKQAEAPSKPAKKAETPAKKADTPAKKADAPAKKADAPAKKADAPAKKADTPAKKTEAPAKNGKPAKKAPPPPESSDDEEEEEEEEEEAEAEEKDEVEEEEEKDSDEEEEKEEAAEEEEDTSNKKAKFDAGAEGEVFLQGCPQDIEDSDIHELFEGMSVTSIKWLNNREGGFNGKGFIKMSASGVDKAIKLSGTQVKGSEITISLPRNAGGQGGGATGEVKTVFVGNLPYSIDEEQIREVFKDCGEITEVRWGMKDGEFRGFGHLEFDSAESAQKAVALNGSDMGGREMKVDLSLPRSGGGGGRGGGFGGGRGGRGGGGFGGGGRGRGGGGFGGGRGGGFGGRGGGGFGGRGGRGGGGGFGGRGGGGGFGGRGGSRGGRGGVSGTRTTF